MGSTPVEVVFSVFAGSDKIIDCQTELFPYTDGPAKIPGPWKRGRPKGTSKKGTKRHRSIENDSTPLQFEFVHLTQQSKDIDETSRAIIRKHAKLNQSRQKNDRNKSSISQREVEDQEVARSERQSLMVIPKLNLPQIPGVDPFDKSPIKLEPYMHDLLLYYSTNTWKNFYSIERLAGYNPVAEYWLPLAFQDPALLHSLIGCADVYICGQASTKDSFRGLKHLHAGISIVNERLRAGKDIMSSGTFTVIATMAILEKGTGRDDNWRIHMQGLKQLVACCGGLESLHSKPMILSKVLRADLYGSLDAAEAPYFNNPFPLLSDLPTAGCFRSEGFNTIHQIINLDNTLRSCIHQLEVATLFWSDADKFPPGTEKDRNDHNNIQENKPTPAEAIQERCLFTNIQYTLLSATFHQRFNDETRNLTFEYCRLTLILYSMTILNERPLSTPVGQQIGAKFRRVLTDLAYQSRHTNHNPTPISWLLLPLPVDFHLWAIFVASSVMMATAESETKSWLRAAFAQLASPEYGAVRDWSDLRSRLRRYLWVPSIHDPVAWRLWSETGGEDAQEFPRIARKRGLAL